MGGNTSKESQEEEKKHVRPEEEEEDDDDDDDDEPDEWDKRIFSTGCADEQTRLNDCHWDKKDWRACTEEMQAFKECWKRKGNDVRTSSKDV